MCSVRRRARRPDEVKVLWDRIKAEEKAKRPSAPEQTKALAGVPVALPALTRALKLQAKAGKVGFDWNDPLAVLAKIREEADEIEAEIASGASEKAAAEVGDLLFAVVNLARHLDADPEGVLRAANQKFERRFGAIERALEAKRQDAEGCDAGRDGRALGRGEGRGKIAFTRPCGHRTWPARSRPLPDRPAP